MLERNPIVGVRNSNKRVFLSLNFSQFTAIHVFISLHNTGSDPFDGSYTNSIILVKHDV